jgi:hypothetical protein
MTQSVQKKQQKHTQYRPTSIARWQDAPTDMVKKKNDETRHIMASDTQGR